MSEHEHNASNYVELSETRKSLDSFDVPPPIPVETPVSMHLETQAVVIQSEPATPSDPQQ